MFILTLYTLYLLFIQLLTKPTTSATSVCGNCKGCLWVQYNACYNWDQITCNRYSNDGYLYCPETTLPSTETTTSSTTNFPNPTVSPEYPMTCSECRDGCLNIDVGKCIQASQTLCDDLYEFNFIWCPAESATSKTSTALPTPSSNPEEPMLCIDCYKGCLSVHTGSCLQLSKEMCDDLYEHDYIWCPGDSTPTTEVPPETPTSSTTSSTMAPVPTSTPPASDEITEKLLQGLQNSDGSSVFMYELPSGGKEVSDLYLWKDMINAAREMLYTGVGAYTLWNGETNHVYGMVSIAAFLAQAMQETIRYNACDENNWSEASVTGQVGGAVYSAASACGQMEQSYQDYKCSQEDNQLAMQTGGKPMECEVDPNMIQRATTFAKWYGAPPALFCAPRSVLPKVPRWDYTSPWCPQRGGWGFVEPFPDNDKSKEYFDYVKDGGSCRDFDGIKTGGWKFEGSGCSNGACPGSAAPYYGKGAREDVEGCCWWGRGVIQTTGVCNFGKLNYYLGKRAKDEGRTALFPNYDFCKNPGAICDPTSDPRIKWTAGFFFYMNAVENYDSGTYLFAY
jgi:predicted chitinase